MADGKAKVGGDGKVVSNTCCYSVRKCNLEKLKGFDFCHKHILEDKASPFTLCSFVAKSNGKRCTNPAPKLSDKEKSCCLIHTRKAELRKAMEKRQSKRKGSHSSVDAILTEMEEYQSGGKRVRTGSSSSSHLDDDIKKEDKAKLLIKVEPGLESSDEESMYDAASGEEVLKVDGAWHGDFDSDAESVDSDEEDPLKHAGVYTVEETAKICRDKLLRLRSMYINQFDHMKHLLKERRRKFLFALQNEDEGQSSEGGSTGGTFYSAEMAATHRYHRHQGIETLLHKQAKERRLGYVSKGGSNQPRCNHGTSTNRCTKKSLPLTKFCLEHIYHDPNQLLFDRCSFRNSNGDTCPKPVADISQDLTCLFHMQAPDVLQRPDLENVLKELADKDRLEQMEKLKTESGDTCDTDQEDVKPDIKELSAKVKLSQSSKESLHCKTVLHNLTAPGMITPGKELASVQPTTQAAVLRPPPSVSNAQDSEELKPKETTILLDSSAAMAAAASVVDNMLKMSKSVESVPVTHTQETNSSRPATVVSACVSESSSSVAGRFQPARIPAPLKDQLSASMPVSVIKTETQALPTSFSAEAKQDEKVSPSMLGSKSSEKKEDKSVKDPEHASGDNVDMSAGEHPQQANEKVAVQTPVNTSSIRPDVQAAVAGLPVQFPTRVSASDEKPALKTDTASSVENSAAADSKSEPPDTNPKEQGTKSDQPKESSQDAKIVPSGETSGITDSKELVAPKEPEKKKEDIALQSVHKEHTDAANEQQKAPTPPQKDEQESSSNKDSISKTDVTGHQT